MHGTHIILKTDTDLSPGSPKFDVHTTIRTWLHGTFRLSSIATFWRQIRIVFPPDSLIYTRVHFCRSTLSSCESALHPTSRHSVVHGFIRANFYFSTSKYANVTWYNVFVFRRMIALYTLQEVSCSEIMTFSRGKRFNEGSSITSGSKIPTTALLSNVQRHVRKHLYIDVKWLLLKGFVCTVKSPLIHLGATTSKELV